MVTMAQDIFDQHKDFVEFDAAGNFVGAWADYYSSSVPKEDPVKPVSSLKITYSGKAPTIKIGGGYKKFTPQFIEPSEDPVPVGQWMFEIDDEDASSLVTTVTDGDGIKVKFNGGDAYLGKNLIIKYVVENGGDAIVPVEIAAL